jgi:class 3 adenylate cyclase
MPMAGTKSNDRTWTGLPAVGSAPRRGALPSYHFVLMLLVGAAIAVVPHVVEGASAAIGITSSGGQTLFSMFLSAVGVAAYALVRYDEGRSLRHAQKMQRALRRYVPGAVAAEIESGHTLELGAREISVLFADIRGFTTFSEGRDAAEIFATVNWFTDRVSEIVHRHGGSVVEFSGDGIMAVFGAPTSLPAMERAAVDAGRAIVAAVSAGGMSDFENLPLGVGVGIATGTDFVGNVRAAGQAIWTAIGNTSNLAARLQGLTRDLDAAMVIDRPTRAACGAAALGFELHQKVGLRGWRETHDVYVLPSHANRTRGVAASAPARVLRAPRSHRVQHTMMHRTATVRPQ